MEIPIVGKLSQADRFVEALKMLINECEITTSFYNGYGLTDLKFKDGSEIEASEAFIRAGYINREKFEEKRNTI